MNRSIERNKVTAILQRAEIAGFQMPDAVLAAIRKEDGLKEALAKTRADLASIPSRSDLQTELRAAGGLPADFAKRLSALQQRSALLKEQELLLSWALEEQAEAIYLTTTREANNIITGQLRPALAALLEEVRQHAPHFPGIPWDDFDRAMQSEDLGARAAYVAVRGATARYAALREAQRFLYDGAEVTWLHEIKNIGDIWPNRQFRGAGNKAPWPSNKEERLAWLVTSEAEVWMPTLAEAEEEALRQLTATRARSGFPGNAVIGVRGPE